jgi:hypothetical protein
MSPCVTLLLNLHDRMTTVTKPLHNYVASDDDEPDDAYCHPFVIMDNMRLTFGCPSVFADETLVWDNKMHAGRADNAKIIAKLTDFLHSHCAGDSLSVRQAKLADMWHAQYNTNACIYIARFTDAVGPTGAHSLLPLQQRQSRKEGWQLRTLWKEPIGDKRRCGELAIGFE